jgi:hypothetical protein
MLGAVGGGGGGVGADGANGGGGLNATDDPVIHTVIRTFVHHNITETKGADLIDLRAARENDVDRMVMPI